MSVRYFVLGSLISVFVLLTAVGCGGPEAGAQKLLAERKYQEVIKKYPDTQFARRAKALLAEDLLEQGKYEEVLKDYSDTRAAYLAVQAQAKALFDAKDYRGVITKFPNTTLAADAERVLSNDLYNQGLFDSLIATYPNSDRGKDVKNARADELFSQAKAAKGQKQIQLLEEITRSYNQSPIYKDAASLLSTLRGKTPPQVKTTVGTQPAKKP
ncbi:MAG: hypothetical protein IPG71_04370 [bacterium]|nr:hypothetical protein [bacterium]